MDVIIRTGQQLAAAANALESVAPRARFWVNFNSSEVQWMKNGQCPLNQPYIDVISLDDYYQPFSPELENYYNWIIQHRATPQQQIALIPGTFYGDGINDPTVQAGYLPGYFAYANDKNQSCNLPLGPRGVTGSFDGCLVWMVLGFAADTFTNGDTTYVGVLDPRAVPISTVWRGQVALPIRSGLAYEPAPQQIVSTLIRQWLNN